MAMQSALRQRLGGAFACCKQVVLQTRTLYATQTSTALCSLVSSTRGYGIQSVQTRTQFPQLHSATVRTLHKSPVSSATQPVGPSLTRLMEAPPFVLPLGLSGLIPFVGLVPPVAAQLPLPDIMAANPAMWQVAYGASILSFLGGVHWGACLSGGPGASTSRFLWSVTPSLLAWPAVALSTVPACGTLAASLVLALGVDQSYARVGLFPRWYSALRWPLTICATLSLLATAYLASDDEDNEETKSGLL
mmetsp:Transcript_35840/g.78255  ORF Transcript_35840/g.78255 Transcript_35840/m.78255 type:complete len:248 (+) Transcript_35840:57-800(+)